MYIDLMLEIPSSPKLISTASVNPHSVVNKYKKVSPEKRSSTDNSNFTIISKYRSLVHVGFVKNKQLVSTNIIMLSHLPSPIPIKSCLSFYWICAQEKSEH